MVKDILNRLRKIIPNGGASLHEPTFAGAESKYVVDCIDSGWVSSVGSYVDRFEKELAQITGAARAVALVNGTSALDLALRILGVQSGDEVLIPAISFAATANAVTYSGAVPHFLEIEPDTLGIDPERLREYLKLIANPGSKELTNINTGRKIRAIISVHIFGHPARMQELARVAEEFGIPLIEDAAEALGSKFQGHHVGRHGRFTMLSFNGNKIATTGGGGALVTNDPELGSRAKHLSTTAKVPHPWRFDHDEIGFNYRMPNLNAALGCAQLEQLPVFLSEKRKLARLYFEIFEDFKFGKILREPKNAESNYWLNALVLNSEEAAHRDDVLSYCHENNLQVRPLWTTLADLQHFSRMPSDDLAVAREMEKRIICLPSGVQIWRKYGEPKT